MRKVMIQEVSRLIEDHEDTLLFLVDIGVWAFHELTEKYPNRAINAGIFEDGLVSVAAGTALNGMVPTIYGITPFMVDRAFEQIKLDFAYQELGGNIITTGASYDFSIAGYSHHCPEDVALLEQIPGIEIITPGSAEEFRVLFRETCRNRKLTYYRLSDYPHEVPIPVEFGKASVIKRGSRATVVACSTMLGEVMKACKDQDVTILYYTTIYPFDNDTFLENETSGKIMICEPFLEGTILYNVMRALRGKSVQVETMGVKHKICRHYGTKEEKDSYNGLNASEIKRRLLMLIEGEENE